MKFTGVIRKIDRLGRIVIPMEFRRKLGVINDEDAFEIFLEGDTIILKKYQPSCMFCGEIKESVIMDDKIICKDCVEKLNKLKENA